MVALRSRRIEAVLGTSLEALAPEHIRSLVTAAVQEAFDLDFKQALYGRADEDKRKLATDVAALANTAGGVIILGVEEDDQARAIGAPGVSVSDAEVARMRQVVASLVAPMPTFDVLTIIDNAAGPPDGGAEGGGRPTTQHGFLVIAVPRSPTAPHAVLVNYGLRFPKRNGATTRYLSEPEVATSYRDRLAGMERQAERVAKIEHEAIDKLHTDGSWIVVSLVPDLPGDMSITYEALKSFQGQVTSEPRTLLRGGFTISRVRVGHRRLLADGTMDSSEEAKWISLELHTDGAGVYAQRVLDLNERRDRYLSSVVDDESMTLGILSGLARLARHAQDRAAAGGNALVRAQLHPISVEKPMAIGHRRGFPGTRGAHTLSFPAAPAEVVAQLDDLAAPCPGLVTAAALLVDELGQAFGIPEMGQFSRDGQVRRQYWHHGWQAEIVAWANNHGIEVTDETL
jgi:hypothetical protein